MLPTFAALLWAATAVKLIQLLRAPDNRLLRTIASGLTAASLGFTVGREPIRTWLEHLLAGLPKLLSNLSMNAAFFALLAFFAYSSLSDRAARHQLRRPAWTVGILLAAAMITWSTIPATVRADPSAASHAGVWQATLYGGLTSVAPLYTVVGTLRHALRYARRPQRTHLRIGLRILVVGLAATVLLQTLSLAAALIDLAPAGNQGSALAVTKTSYIVVLLIAIPCLALGLAYPILAGMVAAFPLWWRHWREFRALRPLWRQVHRAFPELRLRRTWGAVKPWSVHTRRYRRACEIRDGLVLLSPYYPLHPTRGQHHDDAATATAAGSVEASAEQVREALRARAEARVDGSEPVGGPIGVPVPRGRADDAQADDVRWLVDLTRAL